MRRFNYSFNGSLTRWLLFLVFFPLFIALGFWQLQRAEEKKALQLQWQMNQAEASLMWPPSPGALDASLRFKPVVLKGHFDSAHQFLIDNQLQGGQSGYHVLTPLRLSEGPAVLINRGWIPLGENRGKVPVLPAISEGVVTIRGSVDRLHRVALKLQGATTPTDGWPAIVGVPEPGPLAQRLGYDVAPYQVLLDPAEPDGWVRVWQVSHLDPGKNQGYALQWFLFAGVTFIVFIRASLRSSAVDKTP